MRNIVLNVKKDMIFLYDPSKKTHKSLACVMNLISKELLKNRLCHKIEICTVCNKIGICFISHGEKELYNYLSSYIDDLEITKRNLIPPYHVDIFSSKMKLAFEYNGIYWHNELNKEKEYHKMKSDMCLKKGVKLIHIWEDDWKYKNNTIKSNILEYLSPKIYINNYKIVQLSLDIIEEFLLRNSLKYIKAEKGYGLINNNNILSVLVFDNDNNYIIENKNNFFIDKFYYFKDIIKNSTYLLDNDYEQMKNNYKIVDFHYDTRWVQQDQRITEEHLDLAKIYNSGIFKVLIKNNKLHE